MNRPRPAWPVFVSAILVGLLGAVVGYVSLVNGIGRGYCPYSFVPSYHLYKCERLKRATSPKIVFWGGSSAQETLLPDVVSRELGMDVVLAGTIWAMPMRFLPAMVEDVLHEGDVLCLMLEFKEYERQPAEILSPFGVSMLLGVDASMRKTLQPQETLDLYLKKGLGWLQVVIPKRLPHRQYPQYRSRSLYEAVQRHPGSDGVQRIGTYGENVGNYMTTCSEDELIRQPSRFSDEFRRSFDRVVELAHRRKAQVVIGNVVSYSYLRDVGLARFCEEQAKLGVPVCCSPLELCLPYGCHSDATLHCNGAGRKYVTHQVVRGLKRILKGTVEPDVAWPLTFFARERPDAVSFVLPETCRGRETFAELILDRGCLGETNVVRRLLVNGRETAFSERIHPAKNTLWTRWKDTTGRTDVQIEFQDPAAQCRGERILVEPYRLDELARLENFNEVEGFKRSGDNPRHYVATEKLGRLSFRVGEWASNRYCCRLKLKTDPALANVARIGVKSQSWQDAKDGVIEARIVPNESDGFVDGERTAHFGLRFNDMPPGTVVELVSCEFSML